MINPADYQTDPTWAKKMGLAAEPAKYPLGPVLLAVGAVSFVLWCFIAVAVLNLWSNLAGG